MWEVSFWVLVGGLYALEYGRRDGMDGWMRVMVLSTVGEVVVLLSNGVWRRCVLLSNERSARQVASQPLAVSRWCLQTVYSCGVETLEYCQSG